MAVANARQSSMQADRAEAVRRTKQLASLTDILVERAPRAPPAHRSHDSSSLAPEAWPELDRASKTVKECRSELESMLFAVPGKGPSSSSTQRISERLSDVTSLLGDALDSQMAVGKRRKS